MEKEVVSVCGWCKKPKNEQEVRSYEELKLLAMAEILEITNGICTQCEAVYFPEDEETITPLSE